MTAILKQSQQIAVLDHGGSGGGVGVFATGRSTSGQNAAGMLREVSGTVLLTTADSGASINSYFQFCRVPSNVAIKSVELLGTGIGNNSAIQGDLTLAFSDSTTDGTRPGNQIVPTALATTGAPLTAFIVNPLGTPTGLTGTAALFGQNVTVSGVGSPLSNVWTEVAYSSGNFFPFPSTQQPIWMAAGFLADPGAFFDLVLLTTVPLAISGNISATVRLRFTSPTG
jgi:hypothetical protein